MKKNWKTIFFVSFFMLLGIGFLLYAYPLIKAKEKDNARLRVYGDNETHRVDSFSFINQEGKTSPVCFALSLRVEVKSGD